MTHEQIVELCKPWGPMTWHERCVERPEIVIAGSIHNGVYVAIDIAARRVLTESECPSLEIEKMSWRAKHLTSRRASLTA